MKLFHFFVAGILSALGLFAGGLMAWMSSVYHRRWSRRNFPDWKKGSIRRALPLEALQPGYQPRAIPVTACYDHGHAGLPESGLRRPAGGRVWSGRGGGTRAGARPPQRQVDAHRL